MNLKSTLEMHTGLRGVFREAFKSPPGILIPLCSLSPTDRNTDIAVLEVDIFMVSGG